MLQKKGTQKQGKKLWIFAIAVIIVAVIASGIVWAERLKSEAAYKDVQLVVNMDDISTLANAQGLSHEEMAEMLKERGVQLRDRAIELVLARHRQGEAMHESLSLLLVSL